MRAIISKEIEPQPLEEKDQFAQINPEVQKVIESLGDKYTWRTIRGISKEWSLPTQVVEASLNWLSTNNLAVKSIDKERWALTLEGRRYIPIKKFFDHT